MSLATDLRSKERRSIRIMTKLHTRRRSSRGKSNRPGSSRREDRRATTGYSNEISTNGYQRRGVSCDNGSKQDEWQDEGHEREQPPNFRSGCVGGQGGALLPGRPRDGRLGCRGGRPRGGHAGGHRPSIGGDGARAESRDQAIRWEHTETLATSQDSCFAGAARTVSKSSTWGPSRTI